MTHIIDRVINLDMEDYCSRYRDVQLATANLPEIDKKIWIVTHFVKHGYEENRPHKFKNGTPKPQNAAPIETHHRHTQKKSGETKHGREVPPVPAPPTIKSNSSDSSPPNPTPDSVSNSVPNSTSTSVPNSTPTSVPNSTPTSVPNSTPTSVPNSTPTSVPISTPKPVPNTTHKPAPNTTPNSSSKPPSQSHDHHHRSRRGDSTRRCSKGDKVHIQPHLSEGHRPDPVKIQRLIKDYRKTQQGNEGGDRDKKDYFWEVNR